MSLSRFTSSVNGIPAQNKPESFHHFVYDFPGVFGRQFPSAVPKSIGIILEWEFHFNQKSRYPLHCQRSMLIEQKIERISDRGLVPGLLDLSLLGTNT